MKRICLCLIAVLVLLLTGCITSGVNEGLFSNPILPDLNLQIRDIKEVDTLELKIDTKDNPRPLELDLEELDK